MWPIPMRRLDAGWWCARSEREASVAQFSLLALAGFVWFGSLLFSVRDRCFTSF